MSATRPKVLAISSRGGHWTQLRRLRRAFSDCDVIWASTDAALAREVAPDSFVTVPDASRWDRIKLVWSILCVLWLVLRLRPHAIVSTGAAPGYFALRFGRLVGARTLWLDSFANAEELSLSGRKTSSFADVTLTQWAHLGEPLPESVKCEKDRAYYAGAVL
ncbi:MAG: glycosyl transferase [Limnohabitans sp.]|nr:glycosyl transferase [Limnohabitans sp.]